MLCHAWLILKVFVIKVSLSLFFFCFVFRDMVSLCSPGRPETHSVDQAGIELRNPPASASQVLELKACLALSSTLWGILYHIDCQCGHRCLKPHIFLWLRRSEVLEL